MTIMRPRTRTAAATAAAIVPAAVIATAAVIICRRSRLTRRRVTIPVSLAPDAPADQQITGWLSYRGHPAGKTLQVLVHGLSYGAYYWDFPFKPRHYSYVRAATRAGFATFALDRPGVGESSKPPAADLTAFTEAFALRQVIAALRDGSAARVAFERVVLVGHSFGSYVAMVQAGEYGDVDAVILTGAMHALNAGARAGIRARNYPAADDPKFAHANLPPGYLTTRPGAKGPDFYKSNFADPRVIAVDEKLKQTLTAAEVISIDEVTDSAELTRAINVPVLLVVGAQDSLNCGSAAEGLSCADSAAITAREAAFYGPAARLQAYVLARSGHDINLHPDAPAWFAVATRWIRELRPPAPDHPARRGKKP